MYLQASNNSLEVVLSGNITTNHLRWTTSYQDITSTGMTLPQSGDQNITDNTTPVTIVPASGVSGNNRQVVLITVFNSDTVAATVTIQKSVAGTKYPLVRVLLQAGDSIMWSREAGWTINKQSLQESVIITEFTANGTWTKPAGLKRVLITCVGAGGGGGSGRCDGAGTNRFGGGGGGGGAVVWRQVAASDLASSVAVTIGTGGPGGTGVATAATNGNAGTAGGDTSFGSLVIAKGGSGGAGGTGAAGGGGAGGTSAASTPASGPYAVPGTSGGNGQSANGTAPGSGMNGASAAAAGGGGGGINSSNANATAGGTGGGMIVNGILIAGPSSGASPNGASNQSNFLLFSSSLTSGKGLGTGGAGGFPPSTAAGNGGLYGAGGGGGRASLTGTTSGDGGAGAGGLCLVMEVY